MELRHLCSFIAVAEELHFGHAAARLNITLSLLSRQIRQLEAEMGVLLFHRTKRRVQLTNAGQVFLEGARWTVTQAQQAVRTAQRAHRGESGQLVVGFVDSAIGSCLPEILRALRTRSPEVELVLHEMTVVLQKLGGG
jgi:DNA-binding transcriptional LysR family regulator